MASCPSDVSTAPISLVSSATFNIFFQAKLLVKFNSSVLNFLIVLFIKEKKKIAEKNLRN